MLDFIRVPSPAARTITAAGTLALTQLLGIAGPRGPGCIPRQPGPGQDTFRRISPAGQQANLPSPPRAKAGWPAGFAGLIARAPGRGFEPRLTGPKPVVMPLDHPGQQLPRLLYRELSCGAVASAFARQNRRSHAPCEGPWGTPGVCYEFTRANIAPRFLPNLRFRKLRLRKRICINP